MTPTSVRRFGVASGNSPTENREKLQDAIDWAAPRGAALFVEPSDAPYPLASGILLKPNVSLLGVHGAGGRGTRHPVRPVPVGSVFAIEDDRGPVFALQSSTQLRGLQFWYPRQTNSDPGQVIAYPPTVQVSRANHVFGVTLSCLSFFGEYFAIDFTPASGNVCEQFLIDHCSGYPLGGRFISISRCNHAARVLHCTVSPSGQRLIRGELRRELIESVIARGTFSYALDTIGGVELIGLSAGGVYGGIHLGPASRGHLTNFDFENVTVGIHREADPKNRSWLIAQGSIAANAGPNRDQIHPILIEGQGHVALSHVESPEGAGPSAADSADFMHVRGQDALTIHLAGCRMRNYASDSPIVCTNPNALIQAVGCLDKNDLPLNLTVRGAGPTA